MITKYICILNKNTKEKYPLEENWGFYVDIENIQSKIPTNEEILRIKYNLQNVNYLKILRTHWLLRLGTDDIAGEKIIKLNMIIIGTTIRIVVMFSIS
jgi:hypothetical protein